MKTTFLTVVEGQQLLASTLGWKLDHGTQRFGAHVPLFGFSLMKQTAMVKSIETASGGDAVRNVQPITTGRTRATLKKAGSQRTTVARVLVVNDDDTFKSMLAEILTDRGYRVTTAGNVSEALKCISSESYEVIVSDLHMPGGGDGLTVVSAMHRANLDAVTLLLSAFPEMAAAVQAIRLQADEIMVKSIDMIALVELIESRLLSAASMDRKIESVATILGRTIDLSIQTWYEHIQEDELLMSIPMDHEERCGHLPAVFRDMISRLNSANLPGREMPISWDAAKHGLHRRRQGYSAVMLVEESRMLQISTFQTLQQNLDAIDFSVLPNELMVIADEIESQLSQAMTSFTLSSLTWR
jgi:ActR/RegA family two-component response regulator